MHVLIVPSWYPRTAHDANGSFFREQAIALARRGHRVGVVAPMLASLARPGEMLGALRPLAEEIDEGVTTIRARAVNWTPRLERGIRHRWLRRGMRAFEAYRARHGTPDVIHAHSLLDGGVLAQRLSARSGVPYVVTEHSTIYARGMVSADGLRLARDATASAARTMAVSAPFATLLTRTLGPGARGWEVLPNLVNPLFLEHPLVARERDAGFTFINVALMEPKKRQANLVRAFAASFASDPSVRLVLVGDGPERRSVERIVEECGMRHRVRLTGLLPRRDVLREMAAADALVLPSLHETFGVVVVEALALGKPVVVTRCGGPESFVRAEDGVVVPVDDPDALGDALRRVRHDDRQFDGRAIREACRARFGEEAVLSRLATIYSAVR